MKKIILLSAIFLSSISTYATDDDKGVKGSSLPAVPSFENNDIPPGHAYPEDMGAVQVDFGSFGEDLEEALRDKKEEKEEKSSDS